MKFQIFLIGLVVAMSAGAIAVAQSVPVGYGAAAPASQVRLQIPPAAGFEPRPAGQGELAVDALALTPATIVEVPVPPAFVGAADQAPVPQVVAPARGSKATGAGQARAHGKAHEGKKKEQGQGSHDQDD